MSVTMFRHYFLSLVTAFTILQCTSMHAEDPSPPAITPAPEKAALAKFVPPEGWRYGDIPSSHPNVLATVVGEGAHEFPPSINLGTEKYEGTLKEYLKIIKSINKAQGDEWKDLGSIQTESGPASLSQLDMKSQWGEIRMMHVILLKKGTVYILTAAALKQEFPQFYKDFFKAMRSLKIEDNA
jgi:hypothetical protein